MATLENNVDTIPCKHCGSPVRPGMIRCRECRGLLVETSDEFVLSPRVAASVQPKCARCGSPLEPGLDDCPNCASALLDDLLKGPAEVAPPPASSWNSNSTSELRPRQAGTSSAAPGGSWTPLRELAPANDDSSAPVADSRSQLRPTESVAKKADNPQSRSKQQSKKGAAGKANGSAKGRNADDETPPGLFGDDDDEAPVSSKPAPAPVPASVAAPPAPAVEESTAGNGVETSAACAALLASLASADATLRVEIATALGKLGDKEAMGSLERHMVDPDIRVRRAVATALVQLGHEKGELLLDIAERRPAAATLTMAKGSPTPKPKRTGGGGMSIDGDTAKKLGIVVMVLAVVGGGGWYFMNGSSSTPTRKPKKKSSKKAAAVSTPIRLVPPDSWSPIG